MSRTAHGWDDGYRFSDEPVLWFDDPRGRKVQIDGTSGDDDLQGTSRSERFDMRQGGVDVVHGGGGNDVFVFGDTFRAGDKVVGGNGIDTLVLEFNGKANLSKDNFFMVEKIKVIDGDVDIHFSSDGTSTFVFSGGGARFNISVDSANESDFHFRGGNGRDTIVGGDGDDRIRGGAAGDMLTGGGGADSFGYASFTDSGSTFGFDRISDFSQEDRIVLPKGETYVVTGNVTHAGDVSFDYDEDSNVTTISAVLVEDQRVEFQIELSGRYDNLTIIDHNVIIAG